MARSINKTMSTFITPVTDLVQLSQYNKLSPTAASQAVSNNNFRPTSNVETEKKKPDPTDPNTTTKKVIDWGLYNIKGEHIQTQHIGVNIDKTT